MRKIKTEIERVAFKLSIDAYCCCCLVTMIVKLNVVATPYHDQVHYYLTVDFFYVALFGLSFSFLKQYNNACKSIKPKFVLVNFLSKSVLNPHEFLSFIMPFAIFLHSTSNSPKMRESRLKLKLSEIRNFGGRVLSIF